MNEQENPNWKYDLRFVSMNAETHRLGVPPGPYAGELLGFDGSVEGGLRPHPGFLHLVDLTWGFGGSEYGGGTLKGHDWVTLRVDFDLWVICCVYRVVSGGLEQIRVKFRFSDSTTWETDVSHGFSTGLVGSRTESGQMSVTANGRFCFITCKGAEPILFYFTDANGSSQSGGWELTVDANLGAMKQPVLSNPDPNTCCVRARNDLVSEPHPDMQEVLFDWTVPTDMDIPASAKVVYWGFSNVAQVSSDGINYSTNPYLTERDAGSASGDADAVRGPSDLKLPNNSFLWATPPQGDPTFDDARLYDVDAVYVAPTYAYPATEGERNGLNYISGARDVEAKECVGLSYPVDTGQFVWAYQLYDSRTGRYSALSNRMSSMPSDSAGRVAQRIEYAYNQDGDYKLTGWFSPTYPMLDIVYQHERFDTLLFFRGALVQGLTAEQTVLLLDGVFTLEDYRTDAQPVDADWKRACVFSLTTEEELNLQQSFQGSESWLEDMPQAGACMFHESVLLLGNIRQFDKGVAGASMIRWSDLFTTAYELFQPLDRYLLSAPSEEVLRFLPLGQNAVGFTRSTIYLFRRESFTFKGYRMHQGYGVVNDRAAAAVGSNAYFVTRHGLKYVDATEGLSEVAILNYMLQNTWRASLDGVEMAYDEQVGVLLILNPTTEEIVHLWFNNSKVTTLGDCPFVGVREVFAPRAIDEEINEDTNPIEKRAVFLQAVQTASQQTFWRASVMDMGRDKGQYSLLDHEATETRFPATLSSGDQLVVPFTPTAAMRLEGCYIYKLSGNNAGEKAKILRIASSGNKVILDSSSFTPTLGVRLGISPVKWRWVGHPLPLNDPQGVQFSDTDAFRYRQANSIACAFVGVQGDAATDGVYEDARFRGVVYDDISATPVDTAFPVGADGGDVVSVKDGESDYQANFRDSSGRIAGPEGPSLCPGVEGFCPDLDFVLLAVRVDGKIGARQKARAPRS